VSFFEPPPPPPEPPPQPPAPEWAGAPDNVLPASFALEEVLARTEELVVQVHTGRAYPAGFVFVLSLRLRNPRIGLHEDPLMRHWHRPQGSGLTDDMLRFGIELSDGRKATNVGGLVFPGADVPPPEIVLSQGSGGGGGTVWEFNYWAWPIPPAGPLAFVLEWPSEGVPLTRTEIDAERIQVAAERATELWPPAATAWHGRGYTTRVDRMRGVREVPDDPVDSDA
jgi:hypothetical protein